MFKDEMTSKQRVMTALNHKDTDRVPFSLGMGVNLPVKKALRDYLGYKTISEIDNYLMSFNDIISVYPEYIGPIHRNGVKADIWGVMRENVSYGTGSYEEISHYPLSNVRDIKELDDYEWPSSDWTDVSNIKDKISHINKENEYAIRVNNGNIFESAWYMRGFEQMFMDLAINPELAWDIMTRVTDYFIEYFKKILDEAEGMIDIVFTADDIGSQQGMLMSLDMWEKMIKHICH